MLYKTNIQVTSKHLQKLCETTSSWRSRTLVGQILIPSTCLYMYAFTFTGIPCRQHISVQPLSAATGTRQTDGRTDRQTDTAPRFYNALHLQWSGLGAGGIKSGLTNVFISETSTRAFIDQDQ